VKTSGYDGIVPGPPLQARRGEEVRVRLINDLPEPTALHWHGVRLANAMDGAPPLTQSPIAPGESFDYRFIAPDAGTYWYHPPDWFDPMGQPRLGLYGALIVTEADPVDVDRDSTLIFADSPPAAGSTASPLRTSASLSVNGAANFDIRARANDRLRLRLVNASDRRILGLRVAGLRTFVMATDGEPTAPFAARDGRLLLGPGNRMDVFVDCTLAPGAFVPIAVDGMDAGAPVARIVCDAAAASRAVPRDDPPTLPSNLLPERMDFAGALHFDWAFGRTSARDAAVRDSRRGNAPLFAVKRGRTVVAGFSNPTSENRFIHFHGHHFRLLDTLDDGWKPFWLDTLPIAPQSNARIAFVADNPGKWLIEGLGKENATAGWFEVF